MRSIPANPANPARDAFDIDIRTDASLRPVGAGFSDLCTNVACSAYCH